MFPKKPEINDPNVPTIGQPQLIGIIPVVTFVCNCGRSVQMAKAGEKVQCNECKQIWAIAFTGNIQITKVLVEVDMNKALVAQ